jgi:hypothetical protein
MFAVAAVASLALCLQMYRKPKRSAEAPAPDVARAV